jgi:predicted HicB family RNase H-like nuclease
MHSLMVHHMRTPCITQSKPSKYSNFSVRLSPTVKKQLALKAKESGLTVSFLIRKSIANLLKVKTSDLFA